MWVTKTNVIVYCSHFLYSWGTRMWMFALSMFLVRVAGQDSMQLSAIFGLSTGLSVFFLGAIVGDWVDRTPRLKAAQLSLAVQYVLTVGCTAVAGVYLGFQESIHSSGWWLSPLLRAGLVLLGVLADLASQTRVIVVERDWVVEICSSDPDHLASMTAMLRRLDLVTMILAPLAMGQVMEHLGILRGAFFMGGWVLASLFLQLLLTWKVYRIVPALRNMKRSRCPDTQLEPDGGDTKLMDERDKEQGVVEIKSGFLDKVKNGDDNAADRPNDGKTTTRSDNGDNSTLPDLQSTLNEEKETDRSHADIRSKKTTEGTNNLFNERTATIADEASSPTPEKHGSKDARDDLTADKEILCARASRCGLCRQLVTLYRGGRTYLSYSVALPGLSLAFLYMTVLSFDNITVAYIVTQGLTESAVGITMSSSAVFGVLSTFGYTFIRRRTGVVRTGFIGLFCEVSVLTLCVASIWMPGSPFDPWYQKSGMGGGAEDGGVVVAPCWSGGEMTNATLATVTTLPTDTSDVFVNGTAILPNVSGVLINSKSNNDFTNVTCVDVTPKQGPESYISVGFFLAGIFLARFGVWMADLAITQLFLEKVEAAERGIVNGVQSSLNQLFNLLKFALVVAMPDMQTFGFHVLITFCAIATANVLYVIFARRERVGLCCQECLSSSSSSSSPSGPGGVQNEKKKELSSSLVEEGVEEGARG